MYEKIEELLKNKNILIVEDEANLLEIMVESIEEHVNEIFTANNGIEGVELFQSNNIDLIISDIHMAKMTGLRMSHEIRKFDPYIPIIFLTAYDTDENMLEAIEVKSRSVLKKPFDKKQLLVSMLLSMNSFKEEFTLFDLSNGYKYNLDTKELVLNNEIIPLTKKEQRLLTLLLKHQEHSVPFSLIENYVWMESGATPDAIRMFINKLRKKIYPELIQNIQGIGYKLTLK
ncbi:response regulator transcription factor [Arcobacter sp.]|uniref:response regulator transcription factor n=1 Tax=unclassified Arcobacter TaxID=2593671 RepID=UPI003B00FE4E